MGDLWRATFDGAVRRRNPNGVIGLLAGRFSRLKFLSGIAAIVASGAYTQTPVRRRDLNAVMSMLRLDVITFSLRGLAATWLLYIFGVLVEEKQPVENTTGVFD